MKKSHMHTYASLSLGPVEVFSCYPVNAKSTLSLLSGGLSLLSGEIQIKFPLESFNNVCFVDTQLYQ
jgi:hypothetical protein